MLIRIAGATEGIAEYLVHGQKQGRELPRDALDERVVLSGDLELTDAVIQGMTKEGERYLHITISFKEDSLDAAVLKSIVDDFKKFAMSAYDSDEYNFYAEAHLPKVKSYVDKRTGALVERKPHIHIVIPQLNLLSEQNLNPFGKVDQQVKFLEAFQEHANAAYGLASPKDHRRGGYTHQGDMISRYKGDHFEGRIGDLKALVLSNVLGRDITDYGIFKALLGEHGAVRTRNAGTYGEYQNVKPADQAKGINFKDYVFSRGFIEKPAAEKQQFLVQEGSRGYSDSRGARVSAPELAARLKEWHEVRALEVKYINSGSRKLYAVYRQSDREEKMAILAERAGRFYAKYQTSREFDVGAVKDFEELAVLKPLQLGGSAVVKRDLAAGLDSVSAGVDPVSAKRRDSDSVVGQLVADERERNAVSKVAQLVEFTQIKRELDARRLLAHLSKTHGVISDKYEVTKGQDGGDRIRAGTRHLNVSDFLTQEMRFSFAEAAPILQHVFAVQQGREGAEVTQARPEPQRDLWDAFRQAQGSPAQQSARRASEWDAQRRSEQERRAGIRDALQAERRAIQGDATRSPVERKADLSIARMRRVTQDMDLRAAVAEERLELKARQRQPHQAQYRAFLADLAGQGDEAALAELRRQRDSHPIAKGANTIEGLADAGDGKSKEGKEGREKSYLERALAYSVDHLGNVTYYADQTKQRVLVVDSGRWVEVAEPKDSEAVETALRLAVQKFGLALKIEGGQEFRRQMVAAALRTGIQVDFDSKAMNEDLARQRAERDELYARGRTFISGEHEKAAKAQAPQPSSSATRLKTAEPDRFSEPYVKPERDRQRDYDR